jgi:hypothetical protein
LALYVFNTNSHRFLMRVPAKVNLHIGGNMTVTGKIKEAAGYVKEELFEHGKTPEAKEKAQEGRNLRNEGRVEDGKPVLVQPPGTHSEEAEEDESEKA